MTEQAVTTDTKSLTEGEESFLGLGDVLNPHEQQIELAFARHSRNIVFEFSHDLQMAFVFSMIAIAPLAFLMGKATEEIALRTGEAIGGSSTQRSATPLK